jgi:hypothetical protein
MRPNLREVRQLPDGLTLVLQAGDNLALALAQGENRIRLVRPTSRAWWQPSWIGERTWPRCWRRVGHIMPEDPPKLTDPDFWTAQGCVMVIGAFMSPVGMAAAIYYAIEGYTDGPLLVMALLLAVLLLMVATKG